MLGRRRKQWTNIKPALGHHLEFGGWEICYANYFSVTAVDNQFIILIKFTRDERQSNISF